MTEYEYYTEVVSKRQELESKETDACKGCGERLGVPCLKARKCEKAGGKNDRMD